MPLNLKKLVGKLNETTRAALEGGAALCVSRGHHQIEIEHYLARLMEVRKSDFGCICAHFQIDMARLAVELQLALGELAGGNTGSPAFSPSLVALLRDAWCVASLDFGAPKIRSGFTLLALIDPDNRHELPAQLRKLNFAAVEADFDDIVRKSVEKEAPPRS